MPARAGKTSDRATTAARLRRGTRPRSATAAARIYQLLRGELISLQRKPGDLISEAEIALANGVSRTPVREAILKPVLPKKWLDALPKNKVHINPTGKFVIGGPVGDCGLTGRKIIVDTYGGMARHGGGAFSGKDPSKVDRSATYAARYVAKNIVAAGIADKCEVQISYAIGVAEPTSISVTTFGSGKISDDKIEKLVRKHFDLRTYGIIKMLDLIHPIYQATAAYGHFGRKPFQVTYKWEERDGGKLVKKSETATAFSWEKTDRADELRKAAGLKGK